MQRRIIISKGKKYLVNVPGWEDGVWDESQASWPTDPYDNVLYFEGSSLSLPNPTGSVDKSTSTWTLVRGHNCVNMTALIVNDNLITTFDVTNASALTYLDCYNNGIVTLDLHTDTALTYLSCENNGMTSLNISGITGLTEIYCFDNLLAGSLDLSANHSLGLADFSDNLLTSVNIAGTAILTLNLTKNLLTSGAVDAILAALVVNNTVVVPVTTVVQLDGLGNAAPSLAGLASRTTLIGRGWSVNVNP